MHAKEDVDPHATWRHRDSFKRSIPFPLAWIGNSLDVNAHVQLTCSYLDTAPQKIVIETQLTLSEAADMLLLQQSVQVVNRVLQ